MTTNQERRAEAAANRETIERLTTAFNEQDRERFDPCYADEITVHSRSGNRTMDHDEHWAEVEGIFENFPDLTATIDGTVAADDRVFVRWTYAGTYVGEHAGDGIEPDQYVEWAHWSDYRLVDGAIVEAWQLSDAFHLNLELGFVAEVDRPDGEHDESPVEDPVE